ncbi:MAG: DUF2058 family protein [Wenzhouxiangella sp.]
MGSLQDALLKAGLADEKQLDQARSKPSGKRADKRPARPDKRRGATGAAGPKKGARRPQGGGKPSGRGPAEAGKGQGASAKPSTAESDLARAYRARQRAEAAERKAEREARQAAQDERRKRNLQLDELIKGNTLNRKDAELPRYFEHLGRIRRVLCTPEQREQLNSGQIGVVNLRGSYLLVALETLDQYRAIAPDLVPDLAGKDEPEDDGSHYPPVPDDLIW